MLNMTKDNESIHFWTRVLEMIEKMLNETTCQSVNV